MNDAIVWALACLGFAALVYLVRWLFGTRLPIVPDPYDPPYKPSPAPYKTEPHSGFKNSEHRPLPPDIKARADAMTQAYIGGLCEKSAARARAEEFNRACIEENDKCQRELKRQEVRRKQALVEAANKRDTGEKSADAWAANDDVLAALTVMALTDAAIGKASQPDSSPPSSPLSPTPELGGGGDFGGGGASGDF